MTAQPSPQIRFRRAIDARSIPLAELTAREMRHLTLEEALDLVILYAEKGDAKFQRAACKWLARLLTERETLTLADALSAASALVALPQRSQVAALLRVL